MKLEQIINPADFNTLILLKRTNINILLDRMTRLEAYYKEHNNPLFKFVVTSGFRTSKDHIRIYQELARKRGVPFDQDKIPWGSQHLQGCAVDISDPDGELHKWCKTGEFTFLPKIGLYCEEKDDQKRVHFQIYAPRSGKRFFVA